MKKALKLATKREYVSYVTAQFSMSIRQVCRTLSLSRTVFRYQPDARRNEPVMCGKRLRTFNVVDDFDRAALAIEIDLNILAQRIVRVLGRIVVNHGYSLKMRMDNLPELVSLTLAK